MNSPAENAPNVRDYYDKSTRWYQWFYYDRESLGLHYGFWDADTKSRKEAIINQYRAVKDLLSPKPEDYVLDAGCGVGGASFWLMKEAPAHYTGITLSETQLAMAKRYAKKRDPKQEIEFLLGNYFATEFKNETFDKIFAIESFCYSYPHPESLYAEMFRILKPGGKMVISDGIVLRHPKDQEETELVRKFCNGFKLAGWNTSDEIVAALRKTGFVDIRYVDKTESIKKSITDIWRITHLISPLLQLRHLGLVSRTEAENLWATYGQKTMSEKGLFGYGIFIAEKPMVHIG